MLILRVDVADRKLGLSRKQLDKAKEGGEIATEAPAAPNRPRERELRGGTGSAGGQLFNLPTATKEAEAEADDTLEPETR